MSSHPTITPLPPAPQRSDTPSVFTTKADAFVAALAQFQSEANTQADFNNTKASQVSTDTATTVAAKNDAEAAASVATGAANYVGEWSTLSGALNIPASVSHNGFVWILKENVATVQTQEPGIVDKWVKASGETVEKGGDTMTGTLENSAEIPLHFTYSSQVARIDRNRGSNAYSEVTFNVTGISTADGHFGFHRFTNTSGTRAVLVYRGNGTNVIDHMFLGGGGYVCGNPTGGNKGLGTVNAQEIYDNNNRVAIAARNLTAGNGLTGGGDLTANRTFNLGTPGTISPFTGNNVTAESHSHALTGVALDTRSISAGGGLTGGGNLQADRSISMGTPSTLSKGTGNSVFGTSHTHAITGVLSVAYNASQSAGGGQTNMDFDLGTVVAGDIIVYTLSGSNVSQSVNRAAGTGQIAWGESIDSASVTSNTTATLIGYCVTTGSYILRSAGAAGRSARVMIIRQ